MTISPPNDVLRVLIVDDEGLARSRLRDLLGDIADAQPTMVVGMAANGVEALRLLELQPADVVLADIRMPGMDGAELARHLPRLSSPPAVIFVTAYDQYALKAFELNAVDYLLKPFSKDRLLAAVEKVQHRIANEEDNAEKLEELTNFRPGEEYIDRVVVKDRHKIHIITVDQIRYVESLDDYVMIYTNDGRHMKQKTMKYFENSLDPKNFIRIHRSYIVHVAHIAEIQQYEKESYVVIL